MRLKAEADHGWRPASEMYTIPRSLHNAMEHHTAHHRRLNNVPCPCFVLAGQGERDAAGVLCLMLGAGRGSRDDNAGIGIANPYDPKQCQLETDAWS